MMVQKTENPEKDVGDRWKSDWESGDKAYFEYHCWRDHESYDAELWYRSQQPVEVIGTEVNPTEGREPRLEKGLTVKERLECGRPKFYKIRFDDGYEAVACEDELLTSPEYFKERWSSGERPDWLPDDSEKADEWREEYRVRVNEKDLPDEVLYSENGLPTRSNFEKFCKIVKVGDI